MLPIVLHRKQVQNPTRHGMTAVNPGLTGMTPVAVKLSPPQLKLAFMRRYTQSGLTDPRKCRVT